MQIDEGGESQLIVIFSFAVGGNQSQD